MPGSVDDPNEPELAGLSEKHSKVMERLRHMREIALATPLFREVPNPPNGRLSTHFVQHLPSNCDVLLMYLLDYMNEFDRLANQEAANATTTTPQPDSGAR